MFTSRTVARGNRTDAEREGRRATAYGGTFRDPPQAGSESSGDREPHAPTPGECRVDDQAATGTNRRANASDAQRVRHTRRALWLLLRPAYHCRHRTQRDRADDRANDGSIQQRVAWRQAKAG